MKELFMGVGLLEWSLLLPILIIFLARLMALYLWMVIRIIFCWRPYNQMLQPSETHILFSLQTSWDLFSHMELIYFLEPIPFLMQKWMNTMKRIIELGIFGILKQLSFGIWTQPMRYRKWEDKVVQFCHILKQSCIWIGLIFLSPYW